MTSQVEEVKNEGRVVRLSASPLTITQACAESKQGWNLTNLLPGLLVKATIKKVEMAFTMTMTFIHYYFIITISIHLLSEYRMKIHW